MTFNILGNFKSFPTLPKNVFINGKVDHVVIDDADIPNKFLGSYMLTSELSTGAIKSRSNIITYKKPFEDVYLYCEANTYKWITATNFDAPEAESVTAMYGWTSPTSRYFRVDSSKTTDRSFSWPFVEEDADMGKFSLHWIVYIN